MKRYKRAAVTCFIILMVVFLCLPWMKHKAKSWIERYQSGPMQTTSGSVSSSLVYLVKPGQWLSFNIEAGTKQLRIISNAHINNLYNLSVEDDWNYVLRYQLLDTAGKVILDDLYYHRTRLTTYLDQQGEVFFGNFYSGSELTPLDGRLIKLSMPSIQQANSVRISFVQQDPEVKETSIRLYVPAKLLEHRLADTWLRMSEKNKQKMAKNGVYPAALLSQTEKINLLKHQWQPLGPKGIEDKDYISRTLYVVKEVELEKMGEQRIAAGLQIDSDYPGIIAIPEQGGELSIKLTGLDGLPLKETVSLKLSWFGRRSEQRWHRPAQWSVDHDKLTYSVEGGLLEIRSTQAVLVHALLTTTKQQEIDITPKPLLIVAYLAVNAPQYQVLHVNNQSLAMRVDIRRIFVDNPLMSKSGVEYQWFNDKHQLIKSGSLAAKFIPSIYDRLSGELQHLKVSDPISYFLDIPPEVTQLRLFSERNDLLVNAYNQPLHFKKIQRVPENSFVSIDKSDWTPSWFLLHPDNEKDLFKKQAVGRIVAQYRPPEDKQALLLDQYLWKDYRPVEQTQAYYILTAMPVLSDYRDKALASVFCQLKPNKPNQISFKTYGDFPNLRPELIHLRTKKTVFDISVDLDRKRILDMSAMGMQGIFKLSEVSRGKHRIKLKTHSEGQWFINHVKACQSQTYLKRRVFKISNRQLTFIYTNNLVEDKVFSGRFFTLHDNNNRSVINVKIEALQKQPTKDIKQNWTFTDRSYDIKPAKGQPSIILYKQGSYLNSGESFFIPFNSDMPKGQYRITVTLQQGESGYVGLSLLKPGIFEQRQFYRETND